MTIVEAMRRTRGAGGAVDEADPLLTMNPEAPDIGELQREFEDAQTHSADGGRLAAAENIRYTRWEGQTPDGLKHQDQQGTSKRPVRPWDRSADSRVKLVDSAVNWVVDILLAAFWNARPKVSAVHSGILTAMQQAEWRKIISWVVHGPLRGKLVDEVELAAQVGHTLGQTVLLAEWRQEHALTLQKITLEEIGRMAQAAQGPEDGGSRMEDGGGMAAQFLSALLDPTREEEAAQWLVAVFEDLKPARARKVVRQLRSEGEAEFPLPKLVRNEPSVSVLIPGVDFFLPVEATSDLERARCMFKLDWLNVAELEAMAEDADWDSKFIEAAKATVGVRSNLTVAGTPQDQDDNARLIEIVYAYHRQRDAEGVPGIWRTTFSPNVPERYAKHELVDYAHGKYPFTLYRTEAVDRRPDGARGLADTHGVDQAELKKQRDTLYNLSDLTVLPMFRRRGARATNGMQEIGPGAVLNDPTGSIEAIQLPPGKPDLAFALIESIVKGADEYVGRPRADVPPTPAQLRQQRMANRWLLTWAEVLWQLGVMTYQYLTPQELEELLGHPPLLTREMILRHRVILWFDVRTMDSEWVLQMVQAINQFVLPADAGGAIDRNKYVRFILSYFEPTLADEVSTDQEGASQAIFKEVRDEISQMSQGNEAIYVQNDPAAAMKLQFASQIVAANPSYAPQLQRGKAVVDQKLLEQPTPEMQQNPGLHEKLTRDGRFAFLFEKYVANLQQSIAQQENKQVGRLGVKPENAAAGQSRN